MSIFQVKDPAPVYWGHISLLEADLTCLRLLLRSNGRWKFYLNLSGSELPRFSVEQMEAMLSSAAANRSLVGSWPMGWFENRIKEVHTLQRIGYSKP